MHNYAVCSKLVRSGSTRNKGVVDNVVSIAGCSYYTTRAPWPSKGPCSAGHCLSIVTIIWTRSFPNVILGLLIVIAGALARTTQIESCV